jgi:shikimate kinase
LNADSFPPEAGPVEHRALFLVGMMGAGKTTVGRRLARRLGWAFVDADRELEARLGVPIATIFELEGEAGFRRRESALIDELTARGPMVLATGGGAVLDPANRAALHGRGRVVYLRASVGDLWQRL